ncbi:hypothetical protein MMC06_003573 [Schaereria dolodes]|nr:hypothetical protein [Schaereria dolodes]
MRLVNMDNAEAIQSIPTPSEFSVRSRSSSIISCGTKTSITTLPQFHSQSQSRPQYQSQTQDETSGIDVLLGRRNFRITARPGSILSISSFDQPAPPYDGINQHQLTSPTAIPALTEVPTSRAAVQREVVLQRESALSPNHTESQPRYQRQPQNEVSTQLNNEFTGHETELPSPEPTSPISPTFLPIADPDNIISRHYTHIVRTIDNNHRTEISSLQAAHATELASLRSEIAHLRQSHATELSSLRHSIDAAYRHVLKTKDAEVESMRSATAMQISSLESAHGRLLEKLQAEIEEGKTSREMREGEMRQEMETAVQKARNEIEDLWEGRWKDRTNVWKEEGRRREQLLDERVSKERETRDGEWMDGLGTVWPEFVGEIQGLRTRLRVVGSREIRIRIS